MKFFSDLHIHSKYSRATSRQLDLAHINLWAKLKGLNVVATGDFTHPAWFNELKDNLIPEGNGLFRLKDEPIELDDLTVPASCEISPRFILSSEISTIKKRGDRTYKIHHVILLPGLDDAAKLNSKLGAIGNIESDGRPILGLDPRDLLEITMEACPEAIFIPAHIWTPWFSILGSKSGFDSVEDCYLDLADEIFAVETGLSSDPPMNWRVSKLDKYSLVSNSDAHSPSKLAREANVFNCEMSYFGMRNALKSGRSPDLVGTIEFYPHEGKYHYDGHRKCSTRMAPIETRAANGICPVCSRPVTIGVMNRVEELADRKDGHKPKAKPGFKSMVPLGEVLAEVFGVASPSSKAVQREYFRSIEALGPELEILETVPLEDIKHKVSPPLAEAISRVREGKLIIDPGYDGEFGTVKIFSDDEKKGIKDQARLFKLAEPDKPKAKRPAKLDGQSSILPKLKVKDGPPTTVIGLNDAQEQAVMSAAKTLAIIAGPGTGKTRTLTHRIAQMVLDRNISPDHILAVTFTNKAATEMRTRLDALMGDPALSAKVTVKTFHAFCLSVLRAEAGQIGLKPGFAVLDEVEAAALLKKCVPGKKLKTPEASKMLEAIRPFRSGDEKDGELHEVCRKYEAVLKDNNAMDFDGIIIDALKMFRSNPKALKKYQQKFAYILVDEYQDVNSAQHELTLLLSSGENSSLTIVGDPDQSIYGFRGANPDCFAQVIKERKSAESVKLDRSYRSSKTILEASSQVISKKGKGRKKLWSGIEGLPTITLHKARNEHAEAEFIVREIERIMGGLDHLALDEGRVDSTLETPGVGFSDFAVLYRMDAISHTIRKEFETAGIPYQKVGHDPLSTGKLARKALSHIKAQSSGRGDRLVAHLDSIVEEVAAKILNVAKDDELIAAEQVVNALRNLAGRCGSVSELLDHAALSSEVESFMPDVDRVALMTMHASKGLEFDVVFVCGAEDGILPLKLEGKVPADLDEERRLLYVAMTRAKSALYISHSSSRHLFGKRLNPKPSPFLTDIESKLKTFADSPAKGKRKKSAEQKQMKLF